MTDLFQKWNGEFFQRSSLKDLGLRCQLGHRAAEPCSNPAPAHGDEFVVIDSRGIHQMLLDFCNCETAASHVEQLLRASFFPATSTQPRTAATFRVLEQYHLLSLESKVSAYQFYSSLAKLEDNTGLRQVKVGSYIVYIFTTSFDNVRIAIPHS